MLGWDTLLKEIRADVARLVDGQEQLKIDQAIIKEDLRHHIKRTDLLEESLAPVKRHVHQDRAVKLFLAKTIGLLALVATIAGSLIAYYK